VHRLKGHAKAAIRIIVDVAKAFLDVSILKLSVLVVVKDNRISRQIVEGLGSPKVGDMHPRWGLGEVFLLNVSK
jgi:ribosomal-protein-alanine N-acetyltransferase